MQCHTRNPGEPATAVYETRQLKALDLGDFLAREWPPRSDILKPWLPSQGLAMIHAPRGVGKTFIAIGTAYAVASGGQFLVWSAPVPRGVLFIDGEIPAVVMQERLAAVVASADYEPRAPLRLITPDLQDYGVPDLGTVEGQKLVNRHVTDEIGLIVVDSISTLVHSGKENEAESWEPLQTWALGLRRRGKSVLFIHHSGKSGQQRGTSRREDVLDTVITLKRPTDYSPQDGAVFEVHFEKARGIYGEDTAPFEAKLSTDHNGRQIWTTRTLEDTKRERAFELLDTGMNQAEVARELNVHRSTICRYARERNKA